MLLKFAANFIQQFSCSILTDIMNGRRTQRAGTETAGREGISFSRDICVNPEAGRDICRKL